MAWYQISKLYKCSRLYFCTRLGGTGGIVEPGGTAEPKGGGTGGIDKLRGGVVVALLRVGVSKLTWLRSRPAGRDQPIMPL